MHPALIALERALGPVALLRPPAAPNWWVARLALPGLHHAAHGSAATAEAARAAALAEAGEILSLLYRRGDGPLPVLTLTGDPGGTCPAEEAAILDPDHPQDLGSEGAGAGPDLKTALRHAALERLERAALAAWWLGQRPVRALSRAWCETAGLLAAEAAARGRTAARDGAADRRVGYLAVDGPQPVWVILALSRTTDGSAPVLGAAADPDPARAAARALAEVLMMELSHALAVRSAGSETHAPLLARIQALEGAHAGRLRAAGAPISPDPSQSEDPAAWFADLPGPVRAVDMTRAEIGLPVCRVLAPSLPRARPLAFTPEGGPI